jgi:hypothetical protein
VQQRYICSISCMLAWSSRLVKLAQGRPKASVRLLRVQSTVLRAVWPACWLVCQARIHSHRLQPLPAHFLPSILPAQPCQQPLPAQCLPSALLTEPCHSTPACPFPQGSAHTSHNGLCSPFTALLSPGAPLPCRPGNTLYLAGQGGGLVNNMCFPSEVAASYAPPGQVRGLCACACSL